MEIHRFFLPQTCRFCWALCGISNCQNLLTPCDDEMSKISHVPRGCVGGCVDVAMGVWMWPWGCGSVAAAVGMWPWGYGCGSEDVTMGMWQCGCGSVAAAMGMCPWGCGSVNVAPCCPNPHLGVPPSASWQAGFDPSPQIVLSACCRALDAGLRVLCSGCWVLADGCCLATWLWECLCTELLALEAMLPLHGRHGSCQ